MANDGPLHDADSPPRFRLGPRLWSNGPTSARAKGATDYPTLFGGQHARHCGASDSSSGRRYDRRDVCRPLLWLDQQPRPRPRGLGDNAHWQHARRNPRQQTPRNAERIHDSPRKDDDGKPASEAPRQWLHADEFRLRLDQHPGGRPPPLLVLSWRLGLGLSH